MKVQIKTKKLNENAILPTCGSLYAAGSDLYALIQDENGCVTIDPGKTVKVGTGLAMEIPTGYCGKIYARSGLATKQGLRPANAVGVIDSDYRGEIIVALHNDSNEPRTIATGERIAQIIIEEYLPVEYCEVSILEATERGEGGFGSTGTH